MKARILLPALLLIAGIAAVIVLESTDTKDPVQNTIASVADDGDDWPAASKAAIEHMKKMYGEPNEKTASMMIWYNTGPWKRTIVYKKEYKHEFPMPHTDVMEQTIDYKVPTNKFCDLANYDGSVVCNRTNGEISARCDKEGANFLALNLANDIVMGRKNVNDARDFYAKSMMESMKGAMPEYMKKLQFEMPKGMTADPDKMHAMMEKDEKMKMKKEEMKPGDK